MAVKRWDVLRRIITNNGMSFGMEIGVKSGRNMDRVLSACPDFTFYGVDPWEPTENYARWAPQSHAVHEQEARAVEKKHSKRCKLFKGYSTFIASEWNGPLIDLLFIDGDHSYEGVKSDINAWFLHVRPGGIIAGHDYNNTNKYGDAFKGVDRAVHEKFGDNFAIEDDHVWWARV